MVSDNDDDNAVDKNDVNDDDINDDDDDIRRVQHLEGDLEVCEDKLLLATQKLDKVNNL